MSETNHILRALRGLVGKRQLKASRDNAGYREVFVEAFPTERIAVQLQLYLPQLFIRSRSKNSKTIRRKPDDAAARERYEDHPHFRSGADRARLVIDDQGIY